MKYFLMHNHRIMVLDNFTDLKSVQLYKDNIHIIYVYVAKGQNQILNCVASYFILLVQKLKGYRKCS